MKNLSINNIEENSELKQFSIIGHYVRKVGVPAHFIGYKYIIEALKIMMNSQKPLFINEVYRKVAQENTVSANSVEVSIRNAIKRALQINNESIRIVLKNSNSKSLSNSVFLNIMKEMIVEKTFNC